MRNYVIKPGMRGMFSVNAETNEYDVIDYMRTNIDWVYQVPEDGVVHIQGAGDKEVKKDDILILFYSAPHVKHQAIVISSEEWKENIASGKEYEDSKKESKSCEDCDNCENVINLIK